VVRAAFISQHEMGWQPDRKCLKALPEDYAHARLVVYGECFATPGTQPEMLDGMAVRRRRVLPGKLLEAKKSSLAVIEIGRAFRMGAFQIHHFVFAPFLMGSHTHLKGKIRFGYFSVKLN
jgi:hypothetical protein